MAHNIFGHKSPLIAGRQILSRLSVFSILFLAGAFVVSAGGVRSDERTRQPGSAPLTFANAGVAPSDIAHGETISGRGGVKLNADGTAVPRPVPGEGVKDKQPPQDVLMTPRRPSDSVARAAYDMLSTHCARCHQAGKLVGRSTPAKQFGNVLELDQIASDPKLVHPGDPERSRLFQMVSRKECPTDVFRDGSLDQPVPSDADLQTLRRWIGLMNGKQASCSGETCPGPSKDGSYRCTATRFAGIPPDSEQAYQGAMIIEDVDQGFDVEIRTIRPSDMVDSGCQTTAAARDRTSEQESLACADRSYLTKSASAEISEYVQYRTTSIFRGPNASWFVLHDKGQYESGVFDGTAPRMETGRCIRKTR